MLLLDKAIFQREKHVKHTVTISRALARFSLSLSQSLSVCLSFFFFSCILQLLLIFSLPLSESVRTCNWNFLSLPDILLFNTALFLYTEPPALLKSLNSTQNHWKNNVHSLRVCARDLYLRSVWIQYWFIYSEGEETSK